MKNPEKVKVKLILAMSWRNRGSRHIVPLILNLESRRGEQSTSDSGNKPEISFFFRYMDIWSGKRKCTVNSLRNLVIT
jgi:hypothetical protein